MLQGKRIILGVCGSIAAYKAALVVRLLVKQGAEVKVIMTHSARTFITPLTLATLSNNPVVSEFSDPESGSWNNHVELGLWADALLIAPASANTIAKMAHGICDNLLLATYLSARAPVFVAPAMDLDMYAHPSTTSNLEFLTSYGNHIIAAEYGELASGLTGTGRMAEPETLVSALESHFKKKRADFSGKRILITAGPTLESIDPVRYIGNHSTGKMGYALANEAAARGAQVMLISGPTHNIPLNPSVKVQHVTSAEEMFSACLNDFDTSDIAIMAAAVADYKPEKVAAEKIKKDGESMKISLVRTPDIAASLGERKKNGQLLIGFALETENEIAHAEGKLKRKNMDLIVLNSLKDPGAGFGHDTNQITIINKNGEKSAFSLKSKSQVAADILDAIANFSE